MKSSVSSADQVELQELRTRSEAFRLRAEKAELEIRERTFEFQVESSKREKSEIRQEILNQAHGKSVQQIHELGSAFRETREASSSVQVTKHGLLSLLAHVSKTPITLEKKAVLILMIDKLANQATQVAVHADEIQSRLTQLYATNAYPAKIQFPIQPSEEKVGILETGQSPINLNMKTPPPFKLPVGNNQKHFDPRVFSPKNEAKGDS